MPIDGTFGPGAHSDARTAMVIAARPPYYGIDDTLLLAWSRERANLMLRAAVQPLRTCYAYEDRLTAYQAAYEALTRSAPSTLGDWGRLIRASVDAIRAERERFPGRAADDLRAAGIEVTRTTYYGSDSTSASDPHHAVLIHPHPRFEAAYVNAVSGTSSGAPALLDNAQGVLQAAGWTCTRERSCVRIVPAITPPVLNAEPP